MFAVGLLDAHSKAEAGATYKGLLRLLLKAPRLGRLCWSKPKLAQSPCRIRWFIILLLPEQENATAVVVGFNPILH